MIPVSHALPAWWYSNGFGVKLIVVYVLMALDILANNAIEPPDGEVMAFYAITAYDNLFYYFIYFPFIYFILLVGLFVYLFTCLFFF